MRRGRGCLCLALASLLAPAACAASAPADPAIQACMARLDSLDSGYERIADRCPGLSGALQNSELAPWLPGDWTRPGNELSAAGLAELRALAAAQRAARPGGPRPEVAALAAVLAQLPDSGPSAGGLARLLAWLREPPGADQDGGSGWAAPLLARLGQPTAALAAGLLGLVLAAAVTALAAAWRRGRPAPGRRAVPAAAPHPQGAPLAPAALEAAPLQERPRLLLQQLARALREQGRVPAPQGLTVHELTAAAGLPPAERARLAALAQVAEAVRFAPAPPPGADIAAALAQGRRLLAHLAPQGPP